jgi:pentatricopeptide repeat protein
MQKQRWYVADNGIYSKLISVMGRKGQIRMAMWLFSQMRNSGCKPDTSVSIIPLSVRICIHETRVRLWLKLLAILRR